MENTKTEEQRETETVWEEMEYPAAAVLLETARDEYHQEKARSTGLDSKASAIISVIIAMVTLFLPNIPFDKLCAVYSTCNIPLIVAVTVLLCLLTAGAVLLIIGFVKLYQAFQPLAFESVQIDNLNSEHNLGCAQNAVQRGLIDHYCTIIQKNGETNDYKAGKIKSGLKFCMISFAFLCAAAIGLMIATGGV